MNSTEHEVYETISYCMHVLNAIIIIIRTKKGKKYFITQLLRLNVKEN